MRPTTILLYIIAVPTLGFWLVYHSLDTRLAAIETALGGADRLRCNRFQVIKDVSPSVARIIGGEGEGTGFVVEPGFMITNHHVIATEPSPKIVYSDGTFDIGQVVATDPARDLALIAIDKKLSPLWLPTDVVIPVGEQVLTFGYPMGGALDGGVTVNDSTVSGERTHSTNEAIVHYIQLAGGILSGMSGGPVLDMCGRVVGVNALGEDGAFSLAINSITTAEFIKDVRKYPGNFREHISKIEFNPDKSPEELVRAYYNYLKVRNFYEAYHLLSPNFIGNVTYDEWVKGFAYELDITAEIEVDKRNPMRVTVYLSSTDFENGKFVYRYFTGTWLVKKVGNHLKLWESNIREVTPK